ncbi:MAG: ATP-binding protein [Rhodoferax sp.]|nr:ATP-binding protein [Rhodoferax sp.]
MVYLLACLLSLGLLAPAQTQGAAVAPPMTLERAQWADVPALSPPQGAFVQWTRLPDVWRGSSASLPQQRWYHLAFDDAGWELPAVYIERACTNVEVWVNGARVGSGGTMVEPLTRTCYFAQVFKFQRSLLQPTGNRLDLRVAGYPQDMVASRQRVGGLSPVWLGDQSELVARSEARNFWNIDLARVIGIAIGVIGLAMIALGWLRPQSRHPLFFGLALVLWAVMGTRLYVHDVPLHWRAAEIGYTALYAPFAYALVQFLMHFVRQPRQWVQRALLYQCAVVPLMLVAVPSHWLADAAVVEYGLLAAEFLAVIAFFAWHSWRHMRRDFWVLGSVLLLLLSLTVLEVAIQSGRIDLPEVHLLHLAMPVIALVMGVRLVQEFAAALAETERLNRELEARVAQKSVEIEHAYQQLSDLRAEQAALAERQRIAADLHDDLGAQLVTIAQASLVANDIGRVSELARKALADMRLAVRGLTGAAQPVAYVLADWRRETVERLQVAGIATFWNASEAPEEWVFSSRMQVQLTRVLREAVSNVIHHSGAAHCWVDVHVTGQELKLGIEDDGRGFDVQQISPGRGLRNLETRTHTMGGTLHIAPREGGGSAIRVCVPLDGGAAVPADAKAGDIP